jgi:hypothetical protein
MRPHRTHINLSCCLYFQILAHLILAATTPSAATKMAKPFALAQQDLKATRSSDAVSNATTKLYRQTRKAFIKKISLTF